MTTAPDSRLFRTHIVGAGVAGLAAAVRITRSGLPVSIYESAPRAGGRCRSYHDPQLDCVIDNGNHLMMSGNYSVMAYLKDIGAICPKFVKRQDTTHTYELAVVAGRPQRATDAEESTGCHWGLPLPFGSTAEVCAELERSTVAARPALAPRALHQ